MATPASPDLSAPRLYTPDELAALKADDDGTVPCPHPQCWCGDCEARCQTCDLPIGHLDEEAGRYDPDFGGWFCWECLRDAQQDAADGAEMLAALWDVR